MVERSITAAPAATRPGAARVAARRIGSVLVVVGVLAALYAVLVVVWKDPVTGLYAQWRQHELSGQLARNFRAYDQAHPQGPVALIAPIKPQSVPVVRAITPQTRTAAAQFGANLTPGQALGRIDIPRLSLKVVFVNGTSWLHDLTRGPGRYPSTSLPGLGRTTAIAGHRTTFGAWFRHIDDIKLHDIITLELPYGTFRYEVLGHQIVRASDWSIVRNRGFDALVLSACQPLYSASHRWVVTARLRSVTPLRGRTYRLAWSAAATR